MQNLQSIEQFEQYKNGETTIFLFSAAWCKDCVFIDPFMPEVIEKFSNLRFVKIDRDQFIDLCIELDVFGIPSFIAFKEGQELARFVSKDRKTQEEIEQFLTSVS